MGPRRKRPELGEDSRLHVTATATLSSAKKTPSKKRAVTPRTRAAVAIASLDVDRGLHERIERVARRVQRLQRELGEVWEDMQRLLDPGAVAMEEVHPVTPSGSDKAGEIPGEFFTSGDAGDYVLVREFNAAAKRAGLDATAVDLESLGYMKRQKEIDGKNEYVIQGMRLC